VSNRFRCSIECTLRVLAVADDRLESPRRFPIDEALMKPRRKCRELHARLNPLVSPSDRVNAGRSHDVATVAADIETRSESAACVVADLSAWMLEVDMRTP
jgi:hypothetical protein